MAGKKMTGKWPHFPAVLLPIQTQSIESEHWLNIWSIHKTLNNQVTVIVGETELLRSEPKWTPARGDNDGGLSKRVLLWFSLLCALGYIRAANWDVVGFQW